VSKALVPQGRRSEGDETSSCAARKVVVAAQKSRGVPLRPSVGDHFTAVQAVTDTPVRPGPGTAPRLTPRTLSYSYSGTRMPCFAVRSRHSPLQTAQRNAGG
jgi:hypothetical protein